MDQQNQGIQLIDPNEKEQDKKKTAQGAALSSMGSGTVAPTGPQSTAPSASTAARAEQTAGGPKGSGFTGIGKYLGANVGSRLGQAISGRISGAGQQAKAQLGQAVSKFQTGLSGAQQQLGQAQAGFQAGFSGIMQGTSPYIQEQKPAVLGQETPIQGAVNTYRPVTTTGYTEGGTPEARRTSIIRKFQIDPSSLTPEEKAEYDAYTTTIKTKENSEKTADTETTAQAPAVQPVDPAEAYKQLVQRQITSPQGLETTESAERKAAQAAQMAEATRSAGGRAALLQEAFGRGGRLYTRGQTALDALLLGQAGKQLAGARKEAAGVQRQLRSEEKTAQEQARELQSRAQIAAEEARSSVEGAESGIGTEVKAQKQQYEQELDRLTTNLKQEIEAGEISRESADLLKGLGLDPESGQLYNLSKEDIAQAVKARDLSSVTEATSGDIAQLQKINALRKLAGQTQKFTAEDLARAGQTVGKGAAKTGIGATENLSEKLKQARSDYEKLMEQVAPGYKGFGEAREDAKTFATMKDVEKAWGDATSARVDLQRLGSPPTDPKEKVSYDKKVAELNEKIAKGDRASKYYKNLKEFEYSPGEGKTRANVDLASRLYRGELFNPETGELNTDLAKDLSGFLKWRKRYTGEREGLWGAGIYDKYEGDAARVAALEKLLTGVGQKFKVKE